VNISNIKTRWVRRTAIALAYPLSVVLAFVLCGLVGVCDITNEAYGVWRT
jgi:hypothetical protein